MNNIKKLGHQAPILWRSNKFNHIKIYGDLHYCKSHNFVFDTEFENLKLHYGLPCFYTDGRYKEGGNNYFKDTYLYNRRWKSISLKSCIRRTLSCGNIPKGTIVRFEKSYYHPGTKVDNSFFFKIIKENKIKIEYEVNRPTFSKNFTNCEFSKSLVNKLRENGFLVAVSGNTSFLGDMFNTAALYAGSGELIDTSIDGEIATAYGHGLRVGFSSFDNDYNGYSDGRKYILFDFHDEFCKWSRCEHISKEASVDEIVEELIEYTKSKAGGNVLICNNCKDIWISPKDKCDCGCSTLTETHESNRIYARNYSNGEED